jgi:hypothetical protein
VIQRRVVAGIVFAASTSTLAACGFQSPDVTTSEHNSIQAHDFQVGAVRVRDAFVTTVSTTAPAATTYLVLTLVNDSPTADSLTGITTPLGKVRLTGDSVGGALAVPAHGVPVSLEDPAGIDQSGATAMIVTTAPPALGTFVSVQLSFANGGASPTELVPVVPATETTAVSSPVPAGTATPPVEDGEPTND